MATELSHAWWYRRRRAGLGFHVTGDGSFMSLVMGARLAPWTRRDGRIKHMGRSNTWADQAMNRASTSESPRNETKSESILPCAYGLWSVVCVLDGAMPYKGNATMQSHENRE